MSIPNIKRYADDDKIQQLKEFQRAGVQKYLYTKRWEEEKDKTDKKAESMLQE